MVVLDVSLLKLSKALQLRRGHGLTFILRLASISGHGLELSAVSLYGTLVNVLQLNQLRLPKHITRD